MEELNMRSQTRWRNPWLPGLALMALVSMGANSENGCLGNAGGGGPGFGQEGECSAAADCEKFLPDVDCVGSWDCTNTVCSFECSGNTGCTSDTECPGGKCENAQCVSVEPPGCQSDADCGSDEACKAGQCVPVANPPACTSSKDCALDQSCIDGVCVGVECLTDSDCGPGLACVNSACVPVTNPLDCQSDADCKEGSTCECTPDPNCPACDVCLFKCVPQQPPTCVETGCSGEVCASETLFTPCVYEPWYECLALTKCGNFDANGGCGWQKNEAFEQCLKEHAGPKDSCQTDSDCGAGQYCAPGVCPGAPCTPDYCPPCYGTCEDTQPNGVCYGDQDCGPGTHCSVSDGVCLPPPGCKPGMDCPAVCAGYCVPDGPVTCSDDSDCAAGEYCGCAWDATGNSAEPGGADAALPCYLQCIPKEVPSGCTSDSDCGKGEYCGCAPFDGATPPNALVFCNLQCLPIEEPPTECLSNSDCGPNQECMFACPDCVCPFEGDPADPNFKPAPCECGPCFGQCVDVGPQTCSSDADCDKGEYCGCGPFPAGTPATALIACWQQCLPIEEPPVDCANGGQCAPGQECIIACPDCFCPPFDPADPNGAPAPCECGPCFGQCVDVEPPAECQSDSDCAAGQQCLIACPDCACPVDEAGQPLPCDCGPCFGYCEDVPPLPCSSDADCDKGEICGCGPWGPFDPAAKIACFPQCIPDPTPTTCWSDADCANGQVCNVVDFCMPAPDCLPGEPCDAACYGQCVDPEPIGCQSDTDCKKGYYCGCGPMPFSPTALIACLPQCIPVEPTTGQCLTDQECGPDAHCNTQDYCLSPPWCTADMPCPAVCYGLCEAGSTPGTCSDTMPCPAGQICNIEVCEGCTCVPGEPCDCVDSMQCYGTCSDVGPSYDCATDSDCKPGYFCAVEVCSGCACADGAPDCGCPTEPSCKGYCKESGPQPTYCFATQDCPAGQVCSYDVPQAPPAAIPCTPENCDPLPPLPGMCVDAPTGECQVSGCSGQICAAEPMVSTCEWQPWYACYQLAKCGAFGAAGECAWDANPEFVQCMQEFGLK
jgi:eight-cysteine-cluster-containing protein